MFCSNCGEKLDDNVKFCAKCGAPVATKSSDYGAAGQRESAYRREGSEVDDRPERKIGRLDLNKVSDAGNEVKKMFFDKDQSPLLKLGLILIAATVVAFFLVPAAQTGMGSGPGSSWAFTYQWGSDFYMFDIGLFVLGCILVAVGKKKK